VPRPEKPITDEGPVAQFALQLRDLRHQAGSPTYRALSERTHYSPTVLSQAAAGRSLPSWSVVHALVRACGGDVDEWRGRWSKAHEGLLLAASRETSADTSATVPPPPYDAGPAPVDMATPPLSRRSPLTTALTLTLLLTLIGSAINLSQLSRITRPDSAGPHTPPAAATAGFVISSNGTHLYSEPKPSTETQYLIQQRILVYFDCAVSVEPLPATSISPRWSERVTTTSSKPPDIRRSKPPKSPDTWYKLASAPYYVPSLDIDVLTVAGTMRTCQTRSAAPPS